MPGMLNILKGAFSQPQEPHEKSVEESGLGSEQKYPSEGRSNGWQAVRSDVEYREALSKG